MEESGVLRSGKISEILPGEWLGRISTHRGGEGTFTDRDSIYASIKGTVSISSDFPPLITVQTTALNRIYYPKIGDIVYGKVCPYTHTTYHR